MRRFGFLCIFFLGLFVSQVMAQATTRYHWEAADLYIHIPTEWAAPILLEQEGAPVLLLRPTPAGTDTNQISIEYKMLTETPGLQETLQAEFERRGLTMAVSQGFIEFDGDEVLEGFGLDEAQTTYARIQVVQQMEGHIIVVTGTGPIEKLDEINAAFVRVIGFTADLLNEGQLPSMPAYTTLWQRTSTGADGEQAFIQPQALVVGEFRVYVADLLNGILAFDAVTGEYLWTQRVAPDAQITALVVGADDSSFDMLYAADTGACACLYRVTQAGAEIIADGFGPGAPGSLSVRADGAVLATDVSGDGSVRVRVIGPEGEQESLIFETSLLSQPLLLTAPDQTVYAITEANEWLRQEGAGFSLITPLGIPVVIETTQLTVDEKGRLTAFEAGDVYTFDLNGDARLANDRRFPIFDIPSTIVDGVIVLGETPVVAGVAIGPDGTLFTLDLTSTEARLTARSRTIPERLIPNRTMRATSFPNTQKIWLIAGQAGDVIDLTAVPINGDETFLMTLSLINAQGEILGEHTITAEPQPPVSIELEASGLYFLVAQNANTVEQTYELGYRVPLMLTGVDQTVSGTLTQALPIQRWIFNGVPGQTLTARVTPMTGDLDPSLRLVNPRGDEVELSEDLDPVLGVDAGVMEIRLSNSGVYTLEVIAASGVGGYQLTVAIEE